MALVGQLFHGLWQTETLTERGVVYYGAWGRSFLKLLHLELKLEQLLQLLYQCHVL